jgi:hypothetical protein
MKTIIYGSNLASCVEKFGTERMVTLEKTKSCRD